MMIMRTRVPYRPDISDVLIKASANPAFCTRLLDSPNEIVAELNLTPEDAAILTGVQAPNLKEYVTQIKTKLMSSYV